MSSKSPLDSWIVSSLILILLLLAVAAVWFWLPTYLQPTSESLAKRGEYGDSFGSVNALFTGLAFAGLIFTILLQQRDLKLQREDIKNQMSEMRLSRAEIARQADLQERQLATDLAALKMKPLEVKVTEIQIQAEQWIPGARHGYIAPLLDEVREQMNQILNELERPDESA